MNPIAVSVLDRIGSLLSNDGGSVELMELQGGTAKIKYKSGENAECESCVMSSDELGEFVLEALQDRGLAVETVTVVDQ